MQEIKISSDEYSLRVHTPKRLALPEDEVHIWSVRLQQPASGLEQFSGIISQDEQARAARFHFRRDRDRFIITRGFLRRILSRYLQTEAGRLQFCYGEFGKPALSGDGGICFNLSHSHELAVYAVASGRQVGIDVEYIRSEFATDRIAAHFFSARETAVLRSLAPQQQTKAFFDCWTRKEAYIKATGKGVSQPLDAFDVSLLPDQLAMLLRTDDPEEASRWTLYELKFDPAYAAALAVEGRDVKLKYWQPQA